LDRDRTQSAVREAGYFDTEDGYEVRETTAPATPEAQQWEGWGTALKPAWEPVVVARKPLSGTVASNVLEHGTGALNVDATRIGGGERLTGGSGKLWSHYRDDTEDRAEPQVNDGLGRWPANVVLGHHLDCTIPNHPDDVDPPCCHPDCPVRLLDEQSGESKSTGGQAAPLGRSAIYGDWAGEVEKRDPGFGDSGGASQFMTTVGFSILDEWPPHGGNETRFRYQSKASSAERNAGLDGFEEREGGALKAGGNHVDSRVGRIHSDGAVQRASVPRTKNSHPTVKPIELMRWLVRLVTPPGGTVLDPFTGSGSTGIAAVLQGFDFVGCEREPEYAAIAEARIAWWERHRGEGAADEILQAGQERDRVEAEGQGSLFDVPEPEPVDWAGREGEASADRQYTDRGGSNFAMKPGRRRVRQPGGR
jgi:site-specific DNA-methyltransferase (adenine-specific)